MRKYLTLIITATVGISLLLIAPFVLNFESGRINVNEERIYKWLQLLLLALSTFGILRLFNAVVVNSSYTKKLTNEVNLLVAQLKSSSRDSTTDSREHRASTNAMIQSLASMKSAILLWLTKLK